MKQCPKCKSFFPDSDRFCDIDGTPLSVVEDKTPDRKVLPLIAVAGVAIGALLVVVYLTFLRGTTTQEASANSTTESQPQLATVLPPAPSVEPKPSLSVEASPSPSPSPSPSVEPSPSPQASTTPVAVNSGTPTTGGPPLTGQLIIRLISGAKIEAEEVWQTGEGIWYRKGTVVSLLDPKSVKSIDKVAVTPAPAPTASP